MSMAGSEQRNQEYYCNDREQEQHQSWNNARNLTYGYSSLVGLQGQVPRLTRFNNGVLQLGESSNRNNINPQVVSPIGYAIRNSTSIAGSGLKYQDHYRNHNEQVRDQDQDKSWNNTPGYSSHQVHLQTSYNNGEIESGESYNRINLNPHGGTPIGLTLRMMPTFVFNQTELNLAQETQQNGHRELIESQPHHKLRASNIPAVFLKIGSWQWVSKHVGDLAVKFYYGKKKLVWEFLFGSLKKKIEVRWSQVSAINAFVDENKTSRLEIELKERPELCEEIKFQPKKHTQWATTMDDFTNGQAPTCRRHTIVFPPGVLNDPFKRLLQCDNHLFNLSRKPFPYQNPPLFDNQILDFSCNRSIHGCSSIVPNNDHHGTTVPYVPNLVRPIRSFLGQSSSNLPTPVFKSPNLDQNVKVAHWNRVWEQSRNNRVKEISVTPIGEQNAAILPSHDMASGIPGQQLELQKLDIKNGAEFTNKETNFEVDPICKPIKQSYEMKSETGGNSGNVFKEPNSSLAVEVRIGMDDSNNDGNQVTNHMAHVDDEIFSVCDPLAFQERSSWLHYGFSIHEFSNGVHGVNQMGFADNGDLVVYQISNSGPSCSGK